MFSRNTMMLQNKTHNKSVRTQVTLKRKKNTNNNVT